MPARRPTGASRRCPRPRGHARSSGTRRTAEGGGTSSARRRPRRRGPVRRSGRARTPSTGSPCALDPGGDYYAARAILGSVGCSRGRIAVLGAKSGGAARDAAHGDLATARGRVPGGGPRVVRAVRRGEGRARQPPERGRTRVAHRGNADQRRGGLAVGGWADLPDRRGRTGTGQHRRVDHPGFRRRVARRHVVGGRHRGRRRRRRVGDVVDAGRRRPLDRHAAARRRRRSPRPSGSSRRRRDWSRSGSTTTRSRPGRSPTAPGRATRRSGGGTRPGRRPPTWPAWPRWGTRSPSPTATERTSGSPSARRRRLARRGHTVVGPGDRGRPAGGGRW